MSKKIGTHDGSFHVDEALACWMLLKTKKYENSQIVRTRKPDVIETLDIVVDVGGIYDVEKQRFDHHQIGFTSTFDDKHNIKLSSAGLVYKHFGKEVISNLCGTDERETETVYQQVYDNFIEAIDAIDNGINQYPSDVKAKYKVNTDLSSRIGHLHPWWNDTTPNYDQLFKKAVEIAGSELEERILFYGKCWLPARSHVEKALNNRYNVDPSGEIICFEDVNCPWKSHLYDLEEENNVTPNIKYCLFKDSSPTGTWRIQCVPLKDAGFENRLTLPKPWRGLRDDQLSQESGIDGGVFVHISGFIGGNKTREGALLMAQRALQFPQDGSADKRKFEEMKN